MNTLVQQHPTNHARAGWHGASASGEIADPIVRDVALVLAVWLTCAAAVVLTGALHGSMVGVIATVLLVFDAVIFTVRRLR